MSKLSVGKLWYIACRDLGRNKRRSLLTLVAVVLGLALLITMSGFTEGIIANSLENSIRLQTGHVQVRAASYEEEKVSLEWEDLLNDPQGLTKQTQALESVRVATPILWASGLLSARDESVGVRVIGIDPLSEAQEPFREGLVAGAFLDPDDRGGILVSQRLAESLEVAVGQDVSLLVSTADGQPDEAVFTVRGLYDTGISSYDEVTVFLPLSKAQAFTRSGDRASALFVLLDRREDADAVAATLSAPGLSVLTWHTLNEVFLNAIELSKGVMGLMNLIVLAMVAVVIANTLLMAVFERTREMGILAALGMKRRQVLLMFLLEAGTLGLAGIAGGILLGSLIVAYFAKVGLYIGDVADVTSSAMAYGSKIYTRLSAPEVVSLSLTGLIITLLASLYPAWFAARMEPIDALRAL